MSAKLIKGGLGQDGRQLVAQGGEWETQAGRLNTWIQPVPQLAHAGDLALKGQLGGMTQTPSFLLLLLVGTFKPCVQGTSTNGA